MDTTIQKKNFIGSFPLFLIIAIITASPMFFGSVRPWVNSLFNLLIITAFIISISNILKDKEKQPDIRITVLGKTLLFLLMYILFQLIPLPFEALKILSPWKYQILKEVSGQTYYQQISIYSYASMQEFLRISSYLLLYFMVINIETISKKKYIHAIVWAILISGLFQSIYGLFEWATNRHQIFFYKKIYDIKSVTGTFVNRNHFAAYIAMCLPLSMGLLLYKYTKNSEKNIFKIFRDSAKKENTDVITAVISTAIMAIALFFSLSRGGILSFFISITAMFYFLKITSQKKKTEYKLIIFLVLVLALIFIIGINPIIKRFEMIDEQMSLDYSRFSMWNDTTGIFLNFPVFGTGAGTFKEIFPMFRIETNQRFSPSHAHNDYLEMLSDYGTIGFILLFAGFAFFLIAQIKTAKKIESLKAHYMTAGCIGSITAILSHSLVDFSLRIPANAYLFFTILGIFYLSANKRNEYSDKVNFNSQITPAVMESVHEAVTSSKAGV